MALARPCRSSRFARITTAFAAAAAACVGVLVHAAPAHAQEPAACLSDDPAAWPRSSKPYFMVVVDTSGSMTGAVAATNSCGFATQNRIAHARCAVKNTLLAYSGQVNFGLASYAQRNNCTAANNTCNSSATCTVQTAPGGNTCGPTITEPTIGGGTTIRSGANIISPMLQDHYWADPPDLSNVPTMLQMVDNSCSSNNGVANPAAGWNAELFASGSTPLGGVLFDMNRYFANTYTDKWTSAAVPTPLKTSNPAERTCRSLNIILITDGDENGCNEGVNPLPVPGGCRNGQANYLNDAGQALASYEADRMWTNGVTVNGQTYKVKTHVIAFAGDVSQTALNNISTCGGSGNAYSAANEVELATALSNIISSSVKPETCDNADNNCNGCTDEGSVKYCDVGQTCCAWATQAQRTTCLNTYTATINAGDPDGDLTKLPCTTAAQKNDPATWLCYNPLESCDGVDNNCQSGIDEGTNKCGNPLHCPIAETCNGQDDDCDGLVDENVCGSCTPSPEVCDGCDNDCDGIADDGIAPIACGQSNPPNCAGQLTCKAPVAVPIGTCVAGGGFNTCSNAPAAESCDGVDNDCDGIPDDGVPPGPCVPAAAPPGLNYGPSSQCKMGVSSCSNGTTTCNGWVGPSSEICDGIDNDCDGVVDDGVPGVGNGCGINQAPCTPGVTACVGGALVCQGGTGPQPEQCDGIDNDCDTLVDETPLADAPPNPGCWTDAGNCCTWKNAHWCPPTGATCNGVGTLSQPCKTGVLACAGGGGWVCQGPKGPAAEACDGLDNDCDAMVDEGPFPQTGQPCGSDTGECSVGSILCTAGILDCVNDVPPTPEICDGLDNDCDGNIDNGIPAGTTCPVELPPGFDDMIDHTSSPCQPGVLVCDGMGGLVCQGGVGPTAEVCDGIDNDCDGQTDETGGAPEGIDGTANPNPPPVANIGDSCGGTEGACNEGLYACVNGLFACLGAQGPQPEACDCNDNDCNGVIDNPNPGNTPPLCSPGKDCIKAGGSCQCAEPCSGEQGCLPGFTCVTGTDPNDPNDNKGFFCIIDNCGDCATKTVKDANDNTICAPAGTAPDASCVTAPVCVCKSNNCDAPCTGVTCTAPEVCTNYGPNAGKCVVNNCFNVPCQGCDAACNAGSCQDDACEPNPCDPGEICKNTWDASGGPLFVCQAPCDPACSGGQVCDEATGQCVDSLCSGNRVCDGGGCCDPLTGACGNCPCEGVICPDELVCANGDCIVDAGTGGSGGGAGTGGEASGGGGTGNAGASGSNGATNGAGGVDGVWGLSTGGGGCNCSTVGSKSEHGVWALLGLAIALSRRRRRERSGARGAEVSR